MQVFLGHVAGAHKTGKDRTMVRMALPFIIRRIQIGEKETKRERKREKQENTGGRDRRPILGSE